MATLKVTLDKRRIYPDGRNPIIIRITANQRSTSIDTGVKVHTSEWDSSKGKIRHKNPDYKELNLHIKQALLKFEQKVRSFGESIGNKTVVEIKGLLNQDPRTNNNTFSAFANKEIAQLKAQGRFGNAQVYQTALNRLLKYAGEEITLPEITYTLLCDFETHMLKEGLTRNGIAVHMRELRALMNKAIHKGLLDSGLYPFRNYKIKVEKTVSRAITKKDLEKLRKHKLCHGSRIWHSRNIFFLIFNLIGISLVDLVFLTRKNIDHGRIIYKRRKTGKMYSIKINKEAEKLINLYSAENGHYLINIMGLEEIPKNRERHEVNLRLKLTNKYLKELGTLTKCPIPLTTYVARYSWANIAKAQGYSKDLIAEALGHEYGNRVTGIYLDNYGNEFIDKVNKTVTSFKNSLL